jgi:hypothetical protein
MIFVNNVGYSRGRNGASGYCGRQFGTLSRNPENRHDNDDEANNCYLGSIVISFGISITVALILLPVSICCTSATKHPLFVSGTVLVLILFLLGLALSACHSGLVTFNRCCTSSSIDCSTCWHNRCCCSSDVEAADGQSSHADGGWRRSSKNAMLPLSLRSPSPMAPNIRDKAIQRP